MTAEPTRPAPQLDPGRLWAGGLATAVVAGLIALVGILFARGVLEVPVLAPEGDGLWGNANTSTYAFSAAGAALVATALLQLLAATTPSYGRFFTWIMLLVTLVAAVLPLSLEVDTTTRVTTAVINFSIGIAIMTTLNAVARAATTTPAE